MKSVMIKQKKEKKKTAFQKAPTPFLLGRKQMYECFVRCSFSESGRNVVIRRRNLTEKAGAEFVFMFYDFYHPLYFIQYLLTRALSIYLSVCLSVFPSVCSYGDRNSRGFLVATKLLYKRARPLVSRFVGPSVLTLFFSAY